VTRPGDLPDEEGPTAPKLACIFHKTDAGAEPVRDWLLEQPPEVKKKVGDDIRDVQYGGLEIGRPLVGMLGGGLFEVRTSHFDNDYRVLFSISEGKMLLLMGVQKPISKDDIELARSRKRDADKATAERKKATAERNAAAAAKVKKKKP
jgi:phage-related protein